MRCVVGVASVGGVGVRLSVVMHCAKGVAGVGANGKGEARSAKSSVRWRVSCGAAASDVPMASRIASLQSTVCVCWLWCPKHVAFS